MNLRPPAPETYALPLDQRIVYQTNVGLLQRKKAKSILESLLKFILNYQFLQSRWAPPTRRTLGRNPARTKKDLTGQLVER